MGGKKRSIVTAYTSFSTWKLGSQYCNCKGVCAVHIVIIWLNRGELSTKEYLGTPGRVSVLNLPQWLKILQHIQQIKKKSCSVQRPLQPQIITHNLFAFLTVNQIFNVWIYLWHLISFFFFFSEAVGKKWTTSVLCLHLSLHFNLSCSTNKCVEVCKENISHNSYCFTH